MASPYPRTGNVLGHYRILQEIGSGGMGVVYRAHDEKLDRDVALKLLSPGTLVDETARKRFQKEARALAKLNHPNIESVYDFDTQGGTDFLVMELILGATMDQKLTIGGLPEKQILRYGAQLADGLSAAHTQGILHRDLKPGNLRLATDGSVKILDFGLAKIIPPVSEAATTIAASDLGDSKPFAGTLPYMAPEQVLQGTVDVRSDIYSMGAVLYEMATGGRPFPEMQPGRLIDAILNRAPTLPRVVNSRLSQELERIILKCLEREPENRYQSAREVAIDLRRLEVSSSSSVSFAPRLARRKSRVSLLPVAVVALLIAALFGSRIGRFLVHLGGVSGTGRIHSLAVLPLENLSGDPTQEYFSDGMTEELISDLGKIGDLRVISRTSTMRYKGARKTLPQIAHELNVDAILEGSVLRFGNRVRISTQLVQGATDKQLWSHSYESELGDVLGLQRDVARVTAGEILATLTPQERVLLEHTKRVQPEVLEACLKGRYFWNKRTEDGFRKGMDYFQEAIRKDPSYAPAYAGVADSYLMLVEYGLTAAKEGFPKAKEAAVRAVKLDDTLAEAHTSLAAVTEDYDWDWLTAEKEFRRAIDLNPNSAATRQWYAEFLAEMGRFNEALDQATKARDLDPLSLMVNTAMGEVLYESREYERATSQLRQTLNLDATFAEAHRVLGQNYEQLRHHDEAIAEFKEALAFSGGSSQCAALLGRAYARSGQKRQARQLLTSLKVQSQHAYVAPDDLSRLYASLGDKDNAFRLLEVAYEQRIPSMVNLKVDPMLDDLRPDPRFQELLRRVGFPP